MDQTFLDANHAQVTSAIDALMSALGYQYTSMAQAPGRDLTHYRKGHLHVRLDVRTDRKKDNWLPLPEDEDAAAAAVEDGV